MVYENQVSTWNADIHLISTYCFLSKEEAHVFAAEDHVYLVKDVFEYKFENITGYISRNVKISSVLKMLQLSGIVNYEINGSKIIIKGS